MSLATHNQAPQAQPPIPQFEYPGWQYDPKYTEPTGRRQTPLDALEAEALPVYYLKPTAHGETGNEGGQDRLAEKAMLETFRNELLYGPRNEDGSPHEMFIPTAYGIARELGDRQLLRQDTTGKIGTALETTRKAGRPEHYLYGKDGGGAYHHSGRKELGLDRHMLNPDRVQEQLAAEGLELKHPADLKLLLTLRSTGHEAGHALLSGISHYLVAKKEELVKTLGRSIDHDEELRGMPATEAFLTKHPELGFTGDQTVDKYIREEQFAEGYCKLVLRRALQTLEYDDRSADRLAALITDVSYIETERAQGANQIDILGTNRPGEDFMAALTEDPATDYYEGDLGYTLPLSETELVEQLRELGDVVERGGSFAFHIDEEWYRQVKLNQSPAVKQHLETLKARRQAALEGKPALHSAWYQPAQTHESASKGAEAPVRRGHKIMRHLGALLVRARRSKKP